MKQIIVSFLLLIPLWAGGFNSLQSIQSHNELSSGDLKVIIFNMQKAENSGWDQDVFNKLIESSDITLIQEATNELYYSSTRHHHNFYLSWGNQNFETGIASVSSFVAHSKQKLVSPTAEPFLNTPKVSSIESYKIQGSQENLLVINTHGINFKPLYDFQLQMYAIYEAIKDHKGPMLWAGDFNTWNWGRKDYILKVTRALGLKEVEFENRNEFFFVLDHAFVRGLDIQSAKQLDISISDHRPLELILSLP